MLRNFFVAINKGGEAVRFQRFRMRVFYLKGNHCLYQTEYAWHALFRTFKGYRPKSFTPDCLSPFARRLFFNITARSLRKGGLYVQLL